MRNITLFIACLLLCSCQGVGSKECKNMARKHAEILSNGDTVIMSQMLAQDSEWKNCGEMWSLTAYKCVMKARDANALRRCKFLNNQ